MVEIWYRTLGFHNNPFSIKPYVYHPEIIGHDLNGLFGSIENGSVVLIEGEYGNGKTTILKKIINKFGGKGNLIYYSCNRTGDYVDFDGLLKGRKSFLGRLFGSDGEVIVLLDEAQDLSKEDSLRLVDLYNSGKFKSIVLVGKDLKDLQIDDTLKNLIGKNILKLKHVKPEDAVELVRRRIGNVALMNDEIIKEVFNKSDKNPRKLLKNCELVCKYAVDNGYSEVDKEHIRKVLG